VENSVTRGERRQPLPAPSATLIVFVRESLSAFICDVGGQSYFFICLSEEVLGSTRMATELVLVSRLRSADGLKCLNDRLLSGPHISVALANVYHGLLPERHGSVGHDDAHSDANQQILLRRDSLLQVKVDSLQIQRLYRQLR
jgi:hypothetical protein